jgi:signal transduction histidine kinase
MRPRSRIITPLIARGSVIGCVTLMRTGLSNENDTSADLAFAQQLADRAALAVDNSRLFRDTQQALHVRQDVLRFVSHDLKNPLTSLRMPTEILHELIQEGAKHDSPAEIKERIVYGLKHMDTLTLSMWGLVNELLDVSQMQSGQQLPLKRSEVDLVALVGASIAEYQSPDRSIGLRTSEPVLVGRWDEARLRRVVDNLLSNAVKYSPGGGSIQVSIERAGTGDMVRLLVEDHGMGIPAADLPRVFDLFF